jgi:hypothetical protein
MAAISSPSSPALIPRSFARLVTSDAMIVPDIVAGGTGQVEFPQVRAQIGAKDHADGTDNTFLSKVNMSLLDSPFEVRVS